MCGICGVIGIQSKETAEAIVRRMMAAIVHRGPDEEGFLIAPGVAVGARRLSIIDLSGGSQPVWNKDGTLAVVFNGEIYNFRELRQELEAAGREFRTHSDTEVIVHAYEAWREECVPRLRGMFAFAIVEMPQGRSGPPTRVFIARDRLGIKPLYYTIADGQFLFASEVRALLTSNCIPARLSQEAVTAFLLFGSVSEPMSLVEGVISLPPGHSLTIPVGEAIRSLEPKPYWQITDEIEHVGSALHGASLSPARHVRVLLEDAVRSHLVADVPVGVFLSSGLDSTAVATIASRAQKGIHTFTVAFPDAEFSEAEAARKTAKRLGTDHREFALSDQEMVARLDEAVSALDQPSMDGINTYFVSWAARQAGLKVALSGLGSDELFGGYTSFRDTSRVTTVASLARFFPRALRKLASDLMPSLNNLQLSPDASRKALAAWLDPYSLPHPYFFTRALFTPQTVASLLDENEIFWHQTAWGKWLSEAVREARAMDRFTAISWLELRSYLLSTLLRDTDAMSMRHSLEVRVPFLDSSLVEYVLSLPESKKRSRTKPKELLIQALGDLLPEELGSCVKRTFTFPWEKWLRGPLGERVAAGLVDWSPSLGSCLHWTGARDVWKDFLEGRTTWSRPWSLYVLNEWVKRNLGVAEPASAGRARTAAVSVV